MSLSSQLMKIGVDQVLQVTPTQEGPEHHPVAPWFICGVPSPRGPVVPNLRYGGSGSLLGKSLLLPYLENPESSSSRAD